MVEPMPLEMTPEEYEAAKAEWFAQGEEAVERLAASGQAFSFDMVRKELPPALHPNHYGLLMKRRRVRELVTHVGVRPSGIKSRRGGWSAVYAPAGQGRFDL